MRGRVACRLTKFAVPLGCLSRAVSLRKVAEKHAARLPTPPAMQDPLRRAASSASFTMRYADARLIPNASAAIATGSPAGTRRTSRLRLGCELLGRPMLWLRAFTGGPRAEPGIATLYPQ